MRIDTASAVGLTFVLLLGWGAAWAESPNREVVSSGATVALAGVVKVRGTVGQPALGRQASTGVVAELGFWSRPRASVVTVPEDSNSAAHLGARIWPNPFGQSFLLEFYGSPGERTILELFDPQGRQVRRLEFGPSREGLQFVEVQGDRLPAGCYAWRLGVGDQQRHGSIIRLR
ncbi:MAG: hypothetical protein IT349_09880 [Candidatus Eisenbacteria bacterium]|nr:hypothetical protein [Candidatus Eisenbacteria bacterium]